MLGTYHWCHSISVTKISKMIVNILLKKGNEKQDLSFLTHSKALFHFLFQCILRQYINVLKKSIKRK